METKFVNVRLSCSRERLSIPNQIVFIESILNQVPTDYDTLTIDCGGLLECYIDWTTKNGYIPLPDFGTYLKDTLGFTQVSPNMPFGIDIKTLARNILRIKSEL